MSTTDTDAADFRKRLENYGLDESSVLQDRLITVRSAVTRLYSGGGGSAISPIVLRTNDFDDLNRWIGYPDRLFEEVDPFFEAPRLGALQKAASGASERSQLVKGKQGSRARTSDVGKPEIAHAEGMDMAVSAETDGNKIGKSVVRDVARAYLYGDSRRLGKLKPWLSAHFPVIEIAIWAFNDIHVKSGSVLEVGPGTHVLVARKVTIEDGGTIRSRGNLKLDATVLRQAKPSFISAINPALLEIASVNR